ncbi:OmpA family protein [Pedobacter sp. PLR]|uniref:OmpA family protein n=1 Tax=Pedobacter sp. PLR TaxID=2994465 RepID=UPI002247051A|nr:OmpA family protein [Pedobacter sp. PLR]MCX2449995.1 OmpA family protein [Pedobacter sp. PLR]
MAFDLNKNGGSVKDSSDKNPASAKFDLTKEKSIVSTDDASKSKKWFIGLLGLLLVGAGIWYYTADGAIEKSEKIAVTEVNSTDTTPVTPARVPAVEASAVVENSPQAAVPGSSVVEHQVAEKLNNKTAATFRQGSASFNKLDQALIKTLLNYLAENPGASIQVNGYASSDGSLEINQRVSQARADAFKNYLMSNNIAESKVLAQGKGIENPIASNSTNAGRKKNRRVEITLP